MATSFKQHAISNTLPATHYKQHPEWQHCVATHPVQQKTSRTQDALQQSEKVLYQRLKIKMLSERIQQQFDVRMRVMLRHTMGVILRHPMGVAGTH